MNAVSRLFAVINAAFLGLSAFSVSAAPGDLDLAFGVKGKVTAGFADQDFAYGVALQSDGKMVAVGERRNSSNNAEFAVARYTTSGALDTTFNTTGKVTTAMGLASSARAVAVQGDGKIIVAGYGWNGTNYDFAVARYTPAGALDTTFNTTGKVTTPIGSSDDYGQTVTIQSDGKIVVGGYTWNGSNYDFAVVRYTTAGALDTTFNTTGKSSFLISAGDDYAQSVLVQSDGKIVLAGYAVDSAGAGIALARLTSAGALDTGYGTGGRRFPNVGGSDTYGYAAALQSDGKLVVAGSVWNGADWDLLTFRFLATDGSNDASFGTSGYVQSDLGAGNDLALAIAVQSDGKLALGGTSRALSSQTSLYGNDAVFVRYTSAGVLDTTFNTTGVRKVDYAGYGDQISSVAIQSDGRILGVGANSRSESGGNPNFLIERMTTSGGLDLNIETDFSTVDVTAKASVVQPDGKTIVVGDVGTSSDYTSYKFLVARFNTDGSLDTSFGPGGWVTPYVTGWESHGVCVALQGDGKILVGGDSGTPGNFTPYFAVFRLNADGTYDTSFNGGGSQFVGFTDADYCRSITIQSDGKILLGGYTYTYSSGTGDFAVARLTSAGALDTTFDTDGKVTTNVGSTQEGVNSMVVQSDGKIICGGYYYISGSGDDFAIVRYNTNGSLDTSFDGDGKLTTAIGTGYDTLNALALQTDGKIIAVGSSYVSGTADEMAVLRYNTNGSLDATFNTTGKLLVDVSGSFDSATAVIVQGAKILVGGYGYLGSSGGGDEFTVLRINSTGTLDTTFGTGGKSVVRVTRYDDHPLGMGLYGGNLLLGGYAITGSRKEFAVAHILTGDPALDPSFAGDGIQITPFTLGTSLTPARALGTVVQPDGKVIAAGWVTNTTKDFVVSRYNTDGSLDGSFGTGGIATIDFGFSDSAMCVALQSDGKVMVAGEAYNAANTNTDFGLARLNINGTLDASFGTGGKVRTPFDLGGLNHERVQQVLIQPNGKIIAIGWAYNAPGAATTALVRYNSDGTLDSSFGTAGKVTTLVSAYDNNGSAGALQADGKIIVGGYAGNGTNADATLLRYSANGTLDATFGTNGKVVLAIGSGDDFINGVVLQPDGRIFAVGTFFTGGANDIIGLRFNADGSLDPTFDGDGKRAYQVGTADDWGTSVALQPDGRLILGGYYTNGTTQDMAMLRINADGGLDTTFNGTGKMSLAPGLGNDRIYGLQLDPGGNIVAAGLSDDNAFLAAQICVVRVLGFQQPGVWGLAAAQGTGGSNLGITGQINPAGFNTTVSVEYGTTNAFGSTQSIGTFTGSSLQNLSATLYPSGLVAGTTYYYRIVATNANGTTTTATQTLAYAPGGLDFTFSRDGIETTGFTNGSQARSVVVQPDGKVVAAGYGGNGSSDDTQLARYNPDGSLDTSFGISGKVTTDFGGDDGAYCVAVQADGKIVAAGKATVAGSADFSLARYNANGTLDTTFDADGKVTTAFNQGGSNHDVIFAIAIQSDGRIVAVGYAYNSSGTPDIALARYNANGSLDASFGTSGKVTTAIGSSYDYGNAVALQSDGKIIVGGLTRNASNNDDIALLRYLTNGTLDSTFGTAGKVTFAIGAGNEAIYSLALQPDGKIVAAGEYVSSAGDTDGIILRFNTNGGNDSTFDGDGRRAYTISTNNDDLRSVAVQPDGKIVGVGWANAIGLVGDMGILRVNADGSPDTTFDGDGFLLLAPGLVNDRLYGVVLDATGNIVAAGLTNDANGVPLFAVVRVLGFQQLGVWGLAAAQGTGGSNLGVTGQINPAGFSTTVSLEYGTTNSLGNAQSVGTFTGSTLQSFSATLYPGGLAVGTTYYYRIVATNANGATTTATQTLVYAPGALDPTFGGAGYVVTPLVNGTTLGYGEVRGVLVQPDGKIVVGGYANNGSNDDLALARYNANGSLDTSFGGTGIITTSFGSSNENIYALALQSDGKIVAVGRTWNGTRFVWALIRYTSSGGVDSTFGSGGVTTSPGTGNGAALSVAVQSDGKLVVAGYSTNGSFTDTVVARYNINGSLDTGFGTNGVRTIAFAASADDVASAVAVQPDGKIVLAGDRTVSGNRNFVIARLTTTGADDASFGASGTAEVNMGTDDTIRGMVLQPDGKIVACGVVTAGASYDIAAVRLNTNGTLDTSFDSDGKVAFPIGSAYDDAKAIALQPDGKIVLGGYYSNGTNDDMAMVRLNTDGSLDASFDGDGKVTIAPGSQFDQLWALAVAADGSLVGAGRSDTTNGTAQFGVVRVLSLPGPSVTLAAVSSLTTTGVTLNGTVNPNGLASTAQFQYGLTTSYGSTASLALSPNNGSTAQAVAATLTGLQVGTTYHYRLSGTNSLGAGVTNDATFTTLNTAPVAVPGGPYSLQPGQGLTLDGSGSSDPDAANGDNIANYEWDLTNNGTYDVTSSSPSIALTFAQVTAFGIDQPGTYTLKLRVTDSHGLTSTATVSITVSANTSPNFASAATVPNVSNGFTATGLSLGTVSLGFAPAPAAVLTLVNNTSANATNGTFTGLAEGATLTSLFGGNTFTFAISYVGGDGNDITLTRMAGAGQIGTGAPYYWRNFVGLAGGSGNADGVGNAARFSSPNGVAVDSSGNIYVSDESNHTIRKITSAGVVSTLAGSAGNPGSSDGTGTAARFYSPAGMAVDSNGNVYVADRSNHTIRKITSAGVVSTLAGFAGSYGSTDGTGTAARFYSPAGVAVDTIGNVYVADQNNCTIRKITSAGMVTTLAGLAGSGGSTDGTGSAARFLLPAGVAVDSSGNVYVADQSNHTTRKITSAGVVTTLAGLAGSYGSTDGTGSAARFLNPTGVAVDSGGNVYVAERSNHTIRKITSAGVVSTLAGSAGNPGSIDGTGSAARFYFPYGVAVDASGNAYVADQSNHTIRKITSTGVVTTLAGSAGNPGSIDGTGSAARFYIPTGVAVGASGDVYVADQLNHTIRKITSAGVVSTLAGLAGSYGSTDGSGSAARFYFPTGVAVDASGNVYVADRNNFTIRKITSAGAVSTLAGLAGSGGSTDGTGSAARFDNPAGVAVDASGNLYVADSNNRTIRKITSAGVVSTLAGSAGNPSSTDGTGSAARFYFPTGVAVDSSGNVYVADQSNYTIRKITSAGVVTTLAGLAGSYGSTDGTGTAARFYNPAGVAVDSSGNVYVADQSNRTIRKVTSAGVVTTIGGTAGVIGSADGIGTASQFASVQGIAVDNSGKLYVADSGANRISRGSGLTFAPLVTQSATSGLGSASVSLNGTVNPNGFITTAQFEYGPATNYGSTASISLSATNGTTAQAVSATLSGLSPVTTYHYRLTATNVDGTASTSDGTFTTLSNNANLSSLTLSTGTLSPIFASSTASYSATVSNATTSITVTPTAADTNATLKVNNVTTTSGTASNAVSLSVGSNSIPVLVTAQDGSTTQTYTLIITRNTLPVLTLPVSPLTAVATSASGAVVNFSVSANDAESGSLTPNVSPASGSLFPVGDTTVQVSATDTFGETTTSSFIARVLSQQQSWRQTYFGTTNNSGNAADNADFDHDGVPNLAEYAFGLDPTQASSMQLPQGQKSGGSYVVSFTEPSGVSGITYGAEWSTTLAAGSWTPITDTGTALTHTFSVAIGNNSRLFIRLKVTTP